MKTILTLIVAAAIILVLGFVIFPNFGPHVREGRNQAGKALDKASSDDVLYGIYKTELSKKGQELQGYLAESFKLEEQAAQLEGQVEHGKTEVADNEAIMRNGTALLKQSKSDQAISIGAKQYTWQQINDDIIQRIADCNRLKENVQRNITLLNNMRVTRQNLQEKIEQAKTQLQKEARQAEIDKAEAMAYRVQIAANEAVDNAGQLANIDFSQGNLGRARVAWGDRLLQLKAAAQAGDITTPSKVDWPAAYTASETKAIEAAERYFAPPSPKPANTPANVGEALKNAPAPALTPTPIAH